MITALQAAKIFIDKSLQEGEKPLTHKQVQKMIYFLHGWGHVKLDRQLINEEPQAWKHGPVYISVWNALKQWKHHYITNPIEDEAATSNFNGDTTEIINEIYAGCAKYSADDLSDISHEEGGPWHEIYVVRGEANGIISDKSIEKHFVQSYNDVLERKKKRA